MFIGFPGLQTIVINLLVILASQQIKASELKDFIRLFKNKSIPVVSIVKIFG